MTLQNRPNESAITPEMIEAGLAYLRDAGIDILTARVTYPEFVVEFYRAVICAASRPPAADIF
jgi:hypothetical protein